MTTVSPRHESSTLWMPGFVNDLLDDSVEVSSTVETMPEIPDPSPPSHAQSDDENASPTHTANAVLNALTEFLEADGMSDSPTIGQLADTRKPSKTLTTESKKYRIEEFSTIANEQRGSFKNNTIGIGANVSLVSVMYQHLQSPTKKQNTFAQTRLVRQPHSSCNVKKTSSVKVMPRSKSENRQLATIRTSTPAAASSPKPVNGFPGHMVTARSESASNRALSSEHSKDASCTIEQRRSDQELNDSIERINARLSAIDAKLERMQEDDLLHRVELFLDSEI